MPPDTISHRIKAAARGAWIVLLLGLAGLLVNKLELSLGWGLHFMFGNALIFAAARLIGPVGLVGAISIASLQSIILWHHPWAWAIWTIEAATIGLFLRTTSPIRTDVLFWLLLGGPLLALTYGGLMTMDQLSLGLVIAKQAVNGILNVTIGELLYFVMLAVWRRRKARDLPQMSIHAFLLMILMSVILIPTTIYLRIDAPLRERAVKDVVESALNGRLRVTDAALGMWRESRAFMLTTYAVQLLRDPSPRHEALPPGLWVDFDEISIFDPQGRLIRHVGSFGDDPPILPQMLRQLHGVKQPTLTDLHMMPRAGTPHLELVTPFPAAGTGAVVSARLSASLLQSTLTPLVGDSVGGLFLAKANGDYLTGAAVSRDVTDQIRRLQPATRQAMLREAQMIGHDGYGTPLMSNLKDSLIVRAAATSALNGWQVIAVGQPKVEILEARRQQLQLFATLGAFIAFVTLLGSLIAARMKLSLRSLAQSAADLAIMGTERDRIDSLVIRELSDISLNLATVGSQVARERGALVDYQRRLRSIAHHAPVVVYALEVHEGTKARLAYVSEVVERMLGYTPLEVAEPGWWAHAIHPDDYDHSIAAVSDMQIGTIINIEYRLRHKRGHYVWVYDNMAVEADPATGRVEAIGLLIDISDRKTASAQLLQADKMASLGRMVSGITHELNQPLNFIKMAALNLRERLALGQIDPARFAEKLEAILSHIHRASTIILHMRVFGRTPSESARPVSISEASQNVMGMIGSQLEVENITLDTSGSKAQIMVLALPILLEQVLLNLILNARDAIDARRAGGDAAPGLIRITMGIEQDQAIITVEDNGTGMPSEMIPMLFEPFFTTKPPKQGTGLGLSISYGIISDLGGDIRAENSDTGAKFIIRLPLLKGE